MMTLFTFAKRAILMILTAGICILQHFQSREHIGRICSIPDEIYKLVL